MRADIESDFPGEGGVPPSYEPQKTPLKDQNLTHLSLIIIVGILATTLAQPIVLGSLPLRFMLKDQLHVTPTQMSVFFATGAMAWYFKPFAGILTDAFPLFGTRRRYYLLISVALAAICWAAMAFLPHQYQPLLIGTVLINVFMVVASTVIGAFLVEAGQRLGATGRLTALRQVTQNACQMVQGPIGGWLAGGSFALAAGVNALVVLTLFPVVYVFLRENRVQTNSAEALKTAREQLRIIFRSKPLWLAIGLLGLFYFAPGIGTVQLYKQTDELKFTPEYIGLLGTFYGVGGILGAVLFGFLIKKFNLRTMIIGGVLLNAVGTLLFLFYNSKTLAAGIDTQNGFFFTLAEVSLLTLAAKATPKGCEGLGYSLMLSMRNVAQQMADVLGSRLHDSGWKWEKLVCLNAGTTLLALLLVPLFPVAITMFGDKPVMQPEPDR